MLMKMLKIIVYIIRVMFNSITWRDELQILKIK